MEHQHSTRVTEPAPRIGPGTRPTHVHTNVTQFKANKVLQERSAVYKCLFGLNLQTESLSHRNFLPILGRLKEIFSRYN